ncbi:C-5 cytosine-specific DNA methylase [Klebsiella pneumoniae]|nr:C-5 cytosine-specific DNA methylase [Klebsiella pneumoniae]
MSHLTTSKDLPSATFSPGLVDGHMLCVWPDGRITDRFGQEVAHASLSPRLAKALGLVTTDICGLPLAGLSSSADLSASLANKLQEVVRIHGSDLVQNDVERMGYAFGLTPFPAAGVGSPNERERAYWVADANLQYESTARNEARTAEPVRSGEIIWLANSARERRDGVDPLLQRKEPGRYSQSLPEITGSRSTDGLGNSNVTRLEGFGGNDGAAGRERATGPVAAPGVHLRPLEVNGFWRDADWLFCRDGKWRPVEPGTFPLVDGAAARMGRVEPGVARVASSNRVGRLKGYGNAINAKAAAAFIRAYMGGV